MLLLSLLVLLLFGGVCCGCHFLLLLFYFGRSKWGKFADGTDDIEVKAIKRPRRKDREPALFINDE